MRTFAISALACALLGILGAHPALADGGSVTEQNRGNAIRSRGADAAHAELMRDWSYRGHDQGVNVNLRNEPQLNADLTRNWNGAPKEAAAQPAGNPHSRNSKAAYDDLMRNWGG
jgi:hypothetical protein